MARNRRINQRIARNMLVLSPSAAVEYGENTAGAVDDDVCKKYRHMVR